MLDKKIVFFICLLSFFVISQVSAAEDANLTDITGIDDNENDIVIEQTNDNDIKAAERNVTGNTFTDIQKAVDESNDGDTILLSGTYNGEGSEISIDKKKITLMGVNATTLNAKSLSRICSANDDVIFININFINGYEESDNGGALFQGKAYNCTFKNCVGDEGGAIYAGYAENCTFTDCKGISGGALFECDANNCNFIRCGATYEGGAMASGYANNCYFEWCNILCDDPVSRVTETNCTFRDFDPQLKSGGLTVHYNAGEYYKVQVTSQARAVSGVTVVFKINGVKIGEAQTDASGWAKVKITKKIGKYKITSTVKDSSITKTLTVKNLVVLKTVTVKKSAKKLVLTATLEKVNGNYLVGKKVTFKFNGKTYSAKTNKNGIAKVTIKKAVLKKLKVGKKVKYQATYAKNTVTKTAKVKK